MLKVKFWRIGTVVVAKVLEQDECLRCGPLDSRTLGELRYAGKNYKVKSVNHPQLLCDTLYVRGVHITDDDTYNTYNFLNEQDAKDYITAMNKIIHDINIENFLKKDFNVSDEEVEVTIAE